MKESLSIKSLRVAYGGKNAVKDLSLELYEGDILGFIGVNGSGKSSTIKSIMGLVEFNGDIMVYGKLIKGTNAYKDKIGYIPEDIQIFGGFRGKEYLIYVGGLQGISPEKSLERSKKLIEAFNLEHLVNNRIDSFSKGNKQKLAIIASMIHRPKILLLDEPLDGLDLHSIEVYKILLKVHVENGGSVLYSSHILEVVASLSNRIVIISEGSIIKDSNLNQLKDELKSDYSLNEIFNKLTKTTDYESIYMTFKEIFNEDRKD